MSEVSYRDLYRSSVEDSRNRTVLEVQRLLMEHEKWIAAEHERISNLARENAELRLVVGKLESRLEKMADWAKKKNDAEKIAKEKV